MLPIQPKAVELLCDSHHGVFIPQIMGQRLLANGWQGISEEDVKVLDNGPEDELYWDTWNDVLLNCTYTQEDVVYTLHHDGDLYCIVINAMSPTEYYNFFGEFPEWYVEE